MQSEPHAGHGRQPSAALASFRKILNQPSLEHGAWSERVARTRVAAAARVKRRIVLCHQALAQVVGRLFHEVAQRAAPAVWRAGVEERGEPCSGAGCLWHTGSGWKPLCVPRRAERASIATFGLQGDGMLCASRQQLRTSFSVWSQTEHGRLNAHRPLPEIMLTTRCC